MERRLAAILATDMVGFSRLMATDESRTIERQQAHRDIHFDPTIAAQGGRIVKTTGDGLLVEFKSASNALRAAVAIQTAVETQEQAIAPEHRMRYRMGINLGEVVPAGDDLLGDGINVATRLEGISMPGGVCVSDSVRQATSANLDFDFHDLGERSLKNIGRKVHAWQWALGDTPREAPSKNTRPSDRPSIAILPFKNFSREPEDELLCDGIVEDVATALSKISRLFVVARSSTANYRDHQVNLARVGREQGVRYVLEGSLRKSGKRVRVTAQLTDSQSGRQTFAERYDRELSDIFELQDEITREVTTALQIELTDGEQARLWASGTQSFEAWQLCFQAAELVDRHVREDNAKGLKLLERALAIDPGYATAWCKTGWVHWTNGRHHWVRDVSGAYKRARELGRRALEIDPENAEAYSLLAMTALQEGEFEAAEQFAEDGADRAAGQAFVLAILSMVLVHCGDATRAVVLCKKAMELCPVYPNWFRVTLGRGYYLAGHLDRAIEQLRAWYEHDPTGVNPVLLAAALHDDGQVEEAAKVCREMMVNSPDLTIAEWARDQAYKDPKILDRLITVMKRLGMPE